MSNRSHRNSGYKAMNAMNKNGILHSSLEGLNMNMPKSTLLPELIIVPLEVEGESDNLSTALWILGPLMFP